MRTLATLILFLVLGNAAAADEPLFTAELTGPDGATGRVVAHDDGEWIEVRTHFRGPDALAATVLNVHARLQNGTSCAPGERGADVGETEFLALMLHEVVVEESEADGERLAPDPDFVPEASGTMSLGRERTDAIRAALAKDRLPTIFVAHLDPSEGEAVEMCGTLVHAPRG